MSILVTGAAGFIGFHLTKRLLAENYHVIGIDNMNDYYDVQLKKDRLAILENDFNFTFFEIDIANMDRLNQLFTEHSIRIVINLAAQAGVRYSIINPHAYVHSNIAGFMNILEACRHFQVDHFIYASSSSVYGANTSIPFSTSDTVDHPVSIYAATKKSNELMAYTYSHLYQIPTTGLRFFTVYGPWGRPDMAYYSFTRNIIKEKPIKVFNNGDLSRDFTYIDDIIEGIIRLLEKPPVVLNPSAPPPYVIYNLGNNTPVKIMDFIQILENLIGKKAKVAYLPMQPGDVKETYADISDLQNDIGYRPSTPIENGLSDFVEWFKLHGMNYENS
ncbi:MAG: capsular biosynthesis protein CpsI [Neobacillus sp.]|jgi:UDP-glucuronate 4-epimerase|nr:capsular biosynthesis protein CpsI [Neobacillus sp.]